MLQTDDIASCRIASIGDWGAYARGPNGETILLPFHELSWRRLTSTTDVVRVGDEVTLVIQREPIPESRVYLGSIRQVNPQDDPWYDISYLTIGSRHTAVVLHLFRGTVALLAELPSGIALFTRIPAGHVFQPGDRIDVQLTAVSPAEQKIEGALVVETTQLPPGSGI